MRMLRFSFMLFSSMTCSLYCQQAVPTIISRDKAVALAGRHIHNKLIHQEERGWSLDQAILDTATHSWEVQYSKSRMRDWGKTTKNHASDFRRPCKRVNGCRVYKIKYMTVDAITGKVTRIRRDKRVYGNYE